MKRMGAAQKTGGTTESALKILMLRRAPEEQIGTHGLCRGWQDDVISCMQLSARYRRMTLPIRPRARQSQ